jgi:hypothetical protein
MLLCIAGEQVPWHHAIRRRRDSQADHLARDAAGGGTSLAPSPEGRAADPGGPASGVHVLKLTGRHGATIVPTGGARKPAHFDPIITFPTHLRSTKFYFFFKFCFSIVIDLKVLCILSVVSPHFSHINCSPSLSSRYFRPHFASHFMSILVLFM